MERISFSDADCRRMEALGIGEAQVRAQIEVFHKSSFFVELKSPCTVGEGIRTIPAEDTDKYIHLQEKAAGEGRFQKFVPASGAATRMFQSLLQIYHLPHYLEYDELHHKVEQGVAIACDFVRFLEGLKRFPFLVDLEEVMATHGLSLGACVRKTQFRTILDFLLTDVGLNYGSLPKALLKFHRYPSGSRTAFEEHLAEAVPYLKSANRSCHIHFTVPPQHEAGFKDLLEQLRSSYEELFESHFQVGFSFQKPSTDTIAVDLENQPFRERDGKLVFRPGGHGALIENLNELEWDLVYVRNVDNLTQDAFKGTVAQWKKILGGCLVEVQDAVHGLVRKLKNGISPIVAREAEDFVRDWLFIPLPQAFGEWPLDRRHAYLLKKLDRPIRVCGVVKNVGEPGGAPFWVEDGEGTLSVQIVEKAQVDLTSPEQNKIWLSSTHFNPVDIVCGVRDVDGKPFDLKRYVNHEAVFITEKSKGGKRLKALELPGLWNGAMAHWITLIVEVPRATFNPVKTIFDLLKPEHQMPSG